MEDPLGKIRQVYQISVMTARGQNMNSYARRLPIQCYKCAEPHRTVECPIRLQKMAAHMQASQESALAMPVLFCHCCGIDHLIAQCPQNPNAPKITPLNLVEIAKGTTMTPPLVPTNVITRSMLQNPKHVLEKRDIASISWAKKKKIRRKRSSNGASSKPSSKTNLGIGDDPVYINDPEEDSDSIGTTITKTASERETYNEEHREREKNENATKGIDNKSPKTQQAFLGLTNSMKTLIDKLQEPKNNRRKKKMGTYPNPMEEIKQVQHLRGLVGETHQELEPKPRHIKMLDTVFPTQVEPQKIQSPLAIPNIIQEESEGKTSGSG